MFIEKIERKLDKFNIMSKEDIEAYNELISNPLITILNQKTIKFRLEDWGGDGFGTARDDIYLLVEYEERCL